MKLWATARLRIKKVLRGDAHEPTLVYFPAFLEKLLNTDLAHESDTEKILKLDEAAKAVTK